MTLNLIVPFQPSECKGARPFILSLVVSLCSNAPFEQYNLEEDDGSC